MRRRRRMSDVDNVVVRRLIRRVALKAEGVPPRGVDRSASSCCSYVVVKCLVSADLPPHLRRFAQICANRRAIRQSLRVRPTLFGWRLL